MKKYIVSFEYSDGTLYAKEIPAKNKNDAKEFIEAKFKYSKVVKVEERK